MLTIARRARQTSSSGSAPAIVRGRDRKGIVRTVTLSLLSIAGSASSAHARQEQILRILSKTDVLSTCAGNKVKITQGTRTRLFLTDEDGATPEFSIEAGPTLLSLKQKSLPQGTCLGQTYSHQVAAAPSGAVGFELVTLFQPLAESVHLTSTTPFFQHSAFHTRWTASPYEDSSYSFPAEVGLLMTTREIDALEDYYGVHFEHNDHRLGIVFKTEDVELVGHPGMDLGFALDTYGFGELPGADSYFIAFSTGDVETADFSVAPRLWNNTPTQRAYYSLTGALGRGLNVILLREGESQELSRLLAAPTTFPPMVMPLPDGPAAPLNVMNCEPCPPMDQDTCELELPADDQGCPRSSCDLNPTCNTTWKKVGARACGGSSGGGGASSTTSVTITVSGGVSVKLNLFGTEVTPSVGGSASATQGFTVTPGMGQGCGQCAQAYVGLTTCFQTCTVHRRVDCMGCEVHCVDSPETVGCMEVTLDARYCNRKGTLGSSTCLGDPPCP